jgi:hypothetical protein
VRPVAARRGATSSTGSQPSSRRAPISRASPSTRCRRPIAENGEYLLVEITKLADSVRQGEAEVESAVQNAGATKARPEVDAAEKRPTSG